MTVNIYNYGQICKVFVVLLICKETTACLLFKQIVGKRELLLKKKPSPPWEHHIGREVDLNCVCGHDAFDAEDKEEDVTLKTNNVKKSWHIYVHVKSGPDLAKDLVRTCVGTVINSKMVLVSRNCLTVKNGSVPMYATWHPQPKNMANYPMPSPENIIVTPKAKLAEIKEKTVVNVVDIIYNIQFAYKDPRHYEIVGNDLAIIILKDNWPIHDRPPICVPENSINFDPIGYPAYYYGIGGVVEADPTPELKFVGDLVVMPAELCDVVNGNESFCVQYRSNPPTLQGGPLVVPQSGSLNKRGFSPGQTVFLIGLASHAIIEHPGTTITSTVFANILPLVNYLEYYGKALKAIWCKTPRFELEGNRQDPKTGLVKLYPWEDTDSFPTSNYLDRDETLDCVCGLHNLEKTAGAATARIVGGVEATPYEFPWIASYIGWYDPAADVNKSRGSSCGASIINDRVILTAAHCAVEKSRLGKYPDEGSLPNSTEIFYSLHKHNKDDQVIKAEVVETLFLPDYTLSRRQGATNDGDIALVVLKEPIKFSSAKKHGEAQPGDIRPICLPKRNKPVDVEGKMGTLVGWGRSAKNPEDITDPSKWASAEYLQKLEDVPIHPLRECAIQTPGALRDSVICAGSFNRSRGTAKGDSGGPLTVRSNNGYWIEVGLVSYESNFYDKIDSEIRTYEYTLFLYTNVQKYLHFIDFTSRKAGAKWCKDHT